MSRIHKQETQQVEAIHDKPTIEPMDTEECVDAIFTLIKLLFLEWQKFEVFHWYDAQQVQANYRLKSTIDQLYMTMTQMNNTKAENKQGENGTWLR